MKQRFKCRVDKLKDGDVLVVIFTGQREKTTRNPICICLNLGKYYWYLFKNKRVLRFGITSGGFAAQDVTILISTDHKRFNHIILRETIYKLLSSLPLFGYSRTMKRQAIEYLENAL